VAVFAQSQSASVRPSAPSHPQPMITEAVDHANLTRLAGNTHPFVGSAFDAGEAPSGLPMERMLLVLKRRSDQVVDSRRIR
jgi:hypothetical protein